MELPTNKTHTISKLPLSYIRWKIKLELIHSEEGTKAVSQYQQFFRTAGPGWVLKQKFRRILYLTVTEMMLLYGARAWVLSASPRLEKNGLNSGDLPPLHCRLLQNLSNSSPANYYRYHAITSKAQQEATSKSRV
ncbi:hypothetical protein AVEN_221779-1 [Araneus ventricosus]|uniref:Uncharacterized protein n=1 Tax=Araneus ventricosus TaxID=182803 RepID=A0A4Y2UWT9_ARAVE|nr:hypothetical protein AVEN_221779-1 [Araneus ventricosus]